MIENTPEYEFEDYKAAFLVAVEASIQRKGIFLADEGSFKALADNAHGVAVAAARRLHEERKKHAIRALDQLAQAVKTPGKLKVPAP